MKKSLISILVILTILIFAISAVSCGDDSDYTGIETQGFLSDNGTFKVVVPNSTSDFDFLSKIKFNEDASYILSKNESFSDTFTEGKISLNPGDNFIYVKVTDENDHESTYTFNVYRKKMVTVTYNVNGGVIANTSVSVEEGTTVTAPNADKAGYSLSWDYDFKKPIDSDITINAIWTPFDCAIITNVDGEKTRYELAYGTVPSQIVSPSKFGYEFVGWKYGNINFDAAKPYDYNENEIEIVAVFEPIKYVIQYVIFDKESVTNSDENVTTFTIVTNGEEFEIVLKNPIHKSSNFVFIGWSTDEIGKNIITSIDIELVKAMGESHTIALYPQWQIKSNVTYDANGGELEKAPDTFTVGESYALPDNLTRENYIFDGWYNGETKISNSGVWSISVDVQLIANWIPRQNKIEYILNGDGAENNKNNPTSFDVEDEAIELLAPTFDNNHEFIGWYTNPSLADEYKITHITSDMVGMDITLYAKWDKYVNVTLDANGGECDSESIKLQSGKEYSISEPTRAKYHFAGWYYGDVSVKTEGIWLYDFDLTLTAKWVPIEFKIDYKLNEGEINNENNLTIYTVETPIDKLVLYAPTKEFSAFVGWYTDASLAEEFKITSIDPTMYEGITLYPKWEVVKVTINYNANGGSASKEQETLNLGDNYELPVPVKAGHKFIGWYLNEELFANSGRLTNEELTVVNLVAKWTVEEYNITYDFAGGNDGGNTFVNKYTIFTEDFKLPTPIKSGYIFLGWSYDGGEPNLSVVITKGSVGDKSYAAKWMSEKDSLGLLYALNNGELVITGIDRTINSSIVNGIKFPHERDGYKVVAIESYAFKEFGEAFTKTSYANMSSSYVTFYIPTTIKKVGAYAFDTCNGIKISLYDPSKTYADYEAWDKTVVWEDGNAPARDCVWGFRPAIGWTRYSKAEIPDDYE